MNNRYINPVVPWHMSEMKEIKITVTCVHYSQERSILGEASKFITTGCSQNAAAFNSYVYLFLYNLAAAVC